jgi:hypothetical protein
MTPYEIYQEACIKYSCESITPDWHDYYMREAAKVLQLEPSALAPGKCPYVIWDVKGLVMKVKLVGDKLEVNYFNLEQYTDIISKYKEE